MAIQLIQSTDTLETGFRVKANNNFNEIIENITKDVNNNQPVNNGKYRFVKNGGGFLLFDLTDQFYTKTEVAQLLSNISSSPYSGQWSAANPYNTNDVVDLDGKLWRSNANSNTNTPGDNSGKWLLVLNYPVVTVGSDIPGDNNGSLGDIYFRSNGEIYQKAQSGWELEGALQFNQSVLSYFITSGDPDIYNLTSDDLAIINSLGRYPNFKAVINGDGVNDIVDHYDGAPGSFISGYVKLHTDGNGNNLDTTYIQFS